MSDEFLDYKSNPASDTLIRLLRAHQDRVYRLCLQVLRRPHDAEDAAQDVLLKVVDAARSFDDSGAFRRWVYRVSLNAALESARKAARRRVRESRAAMRELPPPPLDDESRRALFEGMAKLDDGPRALLLDHYFEGETLESLGAREGVSAQAVSKRMDKAREDLKRALPATFLGAPDLGRLFEGGISAPVAPDLVSGPVLAKAATVAGGIAMTTKSTVLTAVVITAIVCLTAGTGIGVALKYRSERAQRERVDALERRLAVAVNSMKTTPPDAPPAPPVELAKPEPKPAVSPLASRLARFKAWKIEKKAELEKQRGKLERESLSSYLSNQRREQVKELDGLWELANAEPATFLAFLKAAENQEYIEGFIYGALGFSRLEPGFIMIRGASFGDFSAGLSEGLFELAKSGTPLQRAEALAFFGRLTDVPADYAEYFRNLIFDPEPRVQAAAIGVLAGSKPLSGDNLKALINLGVGSTDDAVRRRIADALRYVDEPEANAYLFDRLESPRDSREFITVATALGHKIMIAAKAGGKSVSEDRFLDAVSAQWNQGHDENSFRVLVYNVLCCAGDNVRPTLAGALAAAPSAAVKEMVAVILRRLEEGEKDREALKKLVYGR